MSDKEVVEILSECLEEVKNNPTIIEVDIGDIPEEALRVKEVVGEKAVKDIKRGSKKIKKFNIDPPKWYKGNEENNASNLSNSNVNNMEPNIMPENTTSNANSSNEAELNAKSSSQEAPKENTTDSSPEVEVVSIPRKSVWFALGAVSMIVVGVLARAYQQSKTEASETDISAM